MRAPGRLAQWLSGKSHLPAETIAYVRIVTGRSVSEWASTQSSSWGAEIPKGVPCTSLANLKPIKSSPQNQNNGPKLSHGQLGEFSSLVILVRQKCWLATKICAGNILVFSGTAIPLL
jgi:hypothetical protein